jgi:hypothetical protein
MKWSSRWGADSLVLLLSLCTFGGNVGACALDQVPSMSMNGHLAVLNKKPPRTRAELIKWAYFIFRTHPRVGQLLHFAENRREVARSLTKQAMEHAAKWVFDDGTDAYGWVVSHTYRKRGIFRITVLAYDQGTHRWYPFDQATLIVRGR